MSLHSILRLAVLAAALASAVPSNAQEPKQSCDCSCAAGRSDGSKIVLGTIKDAACSPCDDACCDVLCGPIIKAENDRRKAKREKLEATRSAAAAMAVERVGSTDWSYATPPQSWKCNKFVFDTLNAAGAKVPRRRGWPPLAGQWADPKVDIPGWTVVTDGPRPGDVVAVKIQSADASGHVAIIVGEGRSVGAGELEVVEGNFGFKPGYKYVYRRYVGAP